MEYMKVILLLSVSISCSSSHRLHNSQVGQNELKDCVCFPKQKDRQPLISYLKPYGGEIKRTVIYVYTDSENQSSVYIPNVEKQQLFPDLTFDDGDHVRLIALELVKSLFSYQHESTKHNPPSHTNHVQLGYSQNNPAMNTNKDSIIIAQKQVLQNNNLDLQANRKRYKETIKNTVNANSNVHDGFVNNIIQVHQKKVNNKDSSKPIHADLHVSQAPVDVNSNNKNMLISSQIHLHQQGCINENCKQLVVDCGGYACSKEYVSELNTARTELNKQLLDAVFNNVVQNENSPQKIELGSHVQNQVTNLSGKVFSIDKQESEQDTIDWHVKENILKDQVSGENTHSHNFHEIIQKVFSYRPHGAVNGQSQPVKVIRVHHGRPSSYIVVPPQVKNVKSKQQKKNVVGSLVSEVEENIPFLPFVSHPVNNLLDIIPNEIAISGGISTSNKDGIKVRPGLNTKEVPKDEDEVKIKIIGGQAATSSGTPLQIKA